MGTKEMQLSVLTHPFSNGPENLKISENLLEKGRIPAVLGATEILKVRTGSETDSEVPLIAGMEGALTVFTYLAEIKNCLIWTIKKPDYFDAFMEIRFLQSPSIVSLFRESLSLFIDFSRISCQFCQDSYSVIRKRDK